MTTSIKLALLGSWQLSINGQQQPKEPRQKVKALLTYLALESNQGHSRELLATLLWPELPKQARAKQFTRHAFAAKKAA